MLDKIVAHKRRQLASTVTDLAPTTADLPQMPPVRSLKEGLIRAPGVAVIAEIKRRSPSKGDLRLDLSAAELADRYTRAGASAISVLTDDEFFAGSVADLRKAKQHTNLPVLRKDFILAESQVYESRQIGADAILLIVAILSVEELHKLHGLARRIGLEVLIEVHSADEVEQALTVDPEIIGINNRDLTTFTVDLKTTEALRELIPPEIACISESGISTRADIRRLAAWHIDGALVGEAIVTSPDPGEKIRELIGGIDDQN